MWPDWIEELKRRYMAEEASVFLLHGAVDVVAWPYEDELLDAGRLVARFLTASRDIVVLYDPDSGRLGWGGIEDSGRFTRHTETALVLDRTSGRPDLRKAEGALGLFWLSMHNPGPNQAFILYRTEKVCPARRSALPALELDAPPLAEWNAAPSLRETDNVVILLTTELDEVRDDLRDSVAVIEVPSPPKPKPVLAPEVEEDPLSLRRQPASDSEAQAAAEAEIEAALSAAAEPEVEVPEVDDSELGASEVDASEVDAPEVAPAPESPADAAPVPEPSSVPQPTGLMVEEALVQAVIRHGADGPPWPGHLPAKEAVAEVLHALAPERFGALRVEVVEDQAIAVGDGADDFNGWWAGDIAVDAACGMALSGLEKPPGGWSEAQPPRFPKAALRALSRRIEKALK